jgi:formylglycine-generating enzyme required for sulfatase activity
MRLLGAVVVCALVQGACGGTRSLPPLGESLIVVDTDMPVPRIISRLRVDFYTVGGRWYESRDLDASVTSAWPLSFAVYLADGQPEQTTIVRLRAYPEGEVRDYRGERFQAKPDGGDPQALVPDPPPTPGPRLLDDAGADITPPSEPTPLLTIDRLLLVRITPSVRKSVRVVLRGACAGTMADIGDFSALSTCIDTEDVLAPLVEAPSSPDLTLPTSVAGSFEAPFAIGCSGPPRPRTTAADGTPLYDEDVCVTGGVYIMGSRDGAQDDSNDRLPERVAALPSFFLDRYEVTVARLRAALASGAITSDALLPPNLTDPVNYVRVNDGPLAGPMAAGGESDFTNCTYSTTPIGREDFPVTCVSHDLARAFCQSQGGDLPLAVQWEYAAKVAGRPYPTHFPWGDLIGDAPPCQDVIFARGTGDTSCMSAGFGPAPVTAVEIDGGDVTPTYGFVNMAGNAGEWSLELYASMRSNCWAESTLVLPTCTLASAPFDMGMGGSWLQSTGNLFASHRAPSTGLGTDSGFRCARKGS